MGANKIFPEARGFRFAGRKVGAGLRGRIRGASQGSFSVMER